MALECALFYGKGGHAIGKITGDNRVSGREGSSEVLEVSHEVKTPRDVATGQATGRRQHGPLRVLKRLDRATVPLRQALVINDTLLKIELLWYRPDPTGAVEIQHFLTITLTNAAVSKADIVLPNTLKAGLGTEDPQEWIEFVYEKITWEWKIGNMVAEDDWHQAV